MASSVAALQRLSASIDVTVSRSNSRASAYEDTKESEKLEAVPTASASEAAIEAEAGHAGGHGPQYLKANCVVYTFYSGDLTAAIDDHFDRALKRSSSHSRQEPGGEDSPNHSDSAKLQRGKLNS